MTTEISEKLRAMKEMIEAHPGLGEYCRKNGDRAAQRFWQLFRSDLMRKKPGEIAEYLTSSHLKLAEATSAGRGFGPDLAGEYFADQMSDHELRVNQEALIWACLEIDAAWKMRRALENEEKPDKRELLQELSNKLRLWSVKC